MEIKNISNCKYNLKGDLFFTADGKQYSITQQDALELVYTLYDSLNLPYTEPDRLTDIIENNNK